VALSGLFQFVDTKQEISLAADGPHLKFLQSGKGIAQLGTKDSPEQAFGCHNKSSDVSAMGGNLRWIIKSGVAQYAERANPRGVGL
jgi:hypothetical protein